jgi:hypothetical protein
LLLALLPVACYGGGDKPQPGTQLLHGHVPAAATQLLPIAHLPLDQKLHLHIGLPLRDPDKLERMLDSIYDPMSPQYRQYMTPDEFGSTFGPTAQDYGRVVAFAKSNGLTVTGTYADHTLLDVDASVADIERVFHTSMVEYKHPIEARNFYAPEFEPSIDLDVKVQQVSGLDNFIVPHSATRRGWPDGTPNNPAAGSGPGGLWKGSDFRKAYAPGVTLNGAGQRLGIYNPQHGVMISDINTYMDQSGISPHVPITKSLLDGSDVPNDSFSLEPTLDLEMAVAMAPGLAQVIVYQSNDNLKAIKQMAMDNTAKQLSTSWIPPVQGANADAVYQQFAAQGQSFFVASADDGAYYPTVPQWADDPWVTIVGGTDLTTSSTGAWQSESCWQQSGGGNHGNYGLPSYQQGINMTNNWGSTQFRNAPDVALVASNIYIWENGGSASVWGTSASAPLWAGFTALVNQQAAQVRQPPVGFLNPAIYSIGKTTAYGASFHDITTGNNLTGWDTTPDHLHHYYAVAGYDLCTGWGTPTGKETIDALAGIQITTNVAPAVASTSNGALFVAATPQGRIYTSQVVLGGAGSRWHEMEGNGRTPSAPAAAVCGNAPYVFAAVRGYDNNVWINQGDLGRPFVGWGVMGGLQTNVSPAVAPTPDGVMFFATRTDGHIFSQRVVLGQAGQGWREVEGGGATDAAPAAALCGNANYWFVVVKGLDGYVYINQGNLGSPFIGWGRIAGLQTNVAPAIATTPDGVIVFATRTDGRIFSNRIVLGQAGQGWVEVGGNGATNAAPAATLVRNNPYIFTLVKGLDNFVYLNQAQLGGGWVGWQRM